MKAVISVIGKDRTGIIYSVSKILYESGVNIEDISQTIMQGYFTMVMLVSIPEDISITELRNSLSPLNEQNLSIQLQKAELFDETHHI
ncbi:MAG: ACT domain-containing protein [Eubacteriaceae bacterium]|nr:ACT domain-containing protein [Eubacteriaceae bacterium]